MARPVQGGGGDLVVEAGARAVVAAAARRGRLVVQPQPQELHPARGRGGVVAHGLLLGLPLPGDPRVTLGVVRPGGTRGGPAALDALHRAVDVQHLEHRLQTRAPEIDHGLQRREGDRPLRTCQHVQGPPHLLLGREGDRREVLPDRLVLLAGQQQHLGVLDTAPGPADLLVVGDGGGGRAQVHDEAEVRFVEPHAQRGRGDQRLDPVRQQVVLRLLPVGVLGPPRVRGHRVPVLAEIGGDLLGRRHRQRVDDPGAGQLAEMIAEPGQPVRRVGQAQHAQTQALPVQRPPQDQRVGARAGAQLLRDVRRHPGVGRGRGGEHRHPGKAGRRASSADAGSRA